MRAYDEPYQKDALVPLVIILIILLLLASTARANTMPARDAALLLRAVNLFESGSERAGMHVLRDYLVRQPGDIEARRTLASFYERMGLVEAARTELKTIVTALPGSLEDRRSLMRLSASAKQWSETLAMAQAFLSADPNDASSLVVAGRASFNLGRQAVAYDYLRRALDLGAESADIHNMLGLIHLARKEHLRARGEFERASILGPDQPMHHNNFGFALELTGDLEGAFLAYDKALTLSPSAASIEANLKRVEARLKKRAGRAVTVDSRG